MDGLRLAIHTSKRTETQLPDREEYEPGKMCDVCVSVHEKHDYYQVVLKNTGVTMQPMFLPFGRPPS